MVGIDKIYYLVEDQKDELIFVIRLIRSIYFQFKRNWFYNEFNILFKCSELWIVIQIFYIYNKIFIVMALVDMIKCKVYVC